MNIIAFLVRVGEANEVLISSHIWNMDRFDDIQTALKPFRKIEKISEIKFYDHFRST